MKKLELEQNPFSLGVRKNTGGYAWAAFARVDELWRLPHAPVAALDPGRVWFLDVAAENSADDKPPRLRAVLAQCRGALCAVVRKGQKIVVYAGAPVPARVDEWIDRLKHGELSWQEISQG